MGEGEARWLFMTWAAFLGLAFVLALSVGVWEPFVGGFLGGVGFTTLWLGLSRLTR